MLHQMIPQASAAGEPITRSSRTICAMEQENRSADVGEATVLKGSVLGLILHDVCEEIKLEELRAILGAKRVEASFKHATPEYVRFEKPPVVERLEPIVLSNGEKLTPQLKYYDYGVISVLLEREFAADWQGLVRLAAGWVPNAELEKLAQQIIRGRLEKIASAVVRVYEEWQSEDYYIFLVSQAPGHPLAADLLAEHRAEIAQMLRGEQTELARSEIDEVLQANLSYYPRDLVVVGWNAALVYDTPAGAETSIQILEYANSQLLEFRHYDEWLTRALDRVYQSLKRRRGILRHWRMGAEASRLNSVTVEVTELAERSETAIKFFSDMFLARLYRLAAAKVGVPEYKNLVDEKLRTAESLNRYFVDDFHQSRGFLLEVMVVIILVIELVYFFKGKG